MAIPRGPKEKKERALGERLQIKGARCESPKCAAVRKPYRPGMHGKGGKRRRGRKMPSDFGRQLLEKQKFKVSYGLTERTLRRIFEEAERSSEGTAMKLVEFLERRLDNVVYRLGFAPSRGTARQHIVHGHVAVNGEKVRSPGFQVSVGDRVQVREGSKGEKRFGTLPESLKKYEPPMWLSLDVGKLEGVVKELPAEESPFEVSLLVESFSK